MEVPHSRLLCSGDPPSSAIPIGQEVTTAAGQWLYASPALLAQHGLTDSDRAPAALLEAPPTELLMGVEDMQHAFWEGTEGGRAMLRQLEHQPFQRSETAARAVQTAPYGNR